MSLLKILVIALFIFLPFGEILRITVGNDVVVKPLDITTVLVAISVFVFSFKNKSLQHSFKSYYFFFPLAGIVSLLLNSFWLKSNELIVAFLYLFRWVSYVGVFFAIAQMDKKFKKKIIYLLLIDGIIILLFGYIQFFFYPSLRNLYYLGWDEHLYRMFSTFLDPNFVGTFFVLYIIFVSGLLFYNLKKYNTRMLILYCLLIIVTLIAIFLTFSRSALLMLIASGITFFLLMQRKKFILYLIGAIIIFVVIISPYFYIENIDLLRINSSIARFQTTQHALQIIQDHPLFGVGFDAYRYAQIRYHFVNGSIQFPAHSASGVDTSLLFVFATTGIIGFISYLYLWFQLFKNAKSSFVKKNPYAIIFIASSVGLFINALFINSLFYAEIMAWMWAIAGLVSE